MKVCRQCGERKNNKDFSKDIYGDCSDICRDCENENIMDDDEREDWEGLIENINKD